MGLDYFPFDVDFFQDEGIQLLRGEHGSLGLEVYMRLLCLIYHNNGYYYVWNERKPALIAQSTGCTPQKIILIVHSCVKWSLFDDKLFCEGGILTSRSIQRRYLAAIRERARKADAAGRQISVEARYWLVDEIETAQGLVDLLGRAGAVDIHDLLVLALLGLNGAYASAQLAGRERRFARKQQGADNFLEGLRQRDLHFVTHSHPVFQAACRPASPSRRRS